MTASLGIGHQHRLGVNRREVLQVGYSGLLGLGLPVLLSRSATSAETGRLAANLAPKAKSVILVFLTGAPSHHDTFDMKPDAPTEIRGEFNPISTSVPGIQVCEHLPHVAARAHQYALIRSLSHKENNHLVATHHVLTGYQQPGAFFDKVASRDDWPCYASAYEFLKPRHDGVPSGVNLPTYLSQAVLTWPGQHAGFLGPKHDPWQIVGDPNQSDFRVDNMRLPDGIDVTRLGNRRVLLDELNRQQKQFDGIAATRRMSDQQDQAFSILTSNGLARAFELDRESAAVRDRYGRHTVGQSLLLARRLVQVGVPVVQANIGTVQTWDNHANIFPTLKNNLLPPLDRGMSALLEDLESQGMLDDTLVVMLGEFGRTPKISVMAGQSAPGRDHWAPVFFGLFAGAGVRGGQVIGKSDEIGAFSVTTPFSPDDIGATIYTALGIEPATEVRDRLGRPVQLNRGSKIDALYSGGLS